MSKNFTRNGPKDDRKKIDNLNGWILAGQNRSLPEGINQEWQDMNEATLAIYKEGELPSLKKREK